MKNAKFVSISFNNRKKQINFLYRSGRSVVVHFGQLGIKGNLLRAWVDRETGNRSVGFELEDGKIDYMPYDQPLALVRDPEYLLQTHIEVLTARIKEELKKRKISKRYLAQYLGTSDNQVQRLLNPQILNKNLEQLYAIAGVLNLEFEFYLKKVA